MAPSFSSSLVKVRDGSGPFFCPRVGDMGFEISLGSSRDSMTFGLRQAQVNKILFGFWPDPSLAQGMIYASQFATSRIYLGHGFDVFICIHTFSHWTSSAYETPKTIIRLRSNGKTHLEGINRAHSIYLLLLSHLQFIGWFSFLHIITTLLLMIGSTYMLSLWTKAFTYLHLKITNTICTARKSPQ